MAELHPGYDVLAKWDSPSFDDVTRIVVADRMVRVPARSFLSEAEWRLLEAIVARLMPQPERVRPIPITPWIDAALAADRGDGYRHDGVPPLREAWRTGLAAIAEEAGHAGFHALDAAAQDALLVRIQRGEVDAKHWGELSAEYFFDQLLLRTVAGIYYAHPSAWNEIGFGGPASPRGYVRMGFDGRDPWEAGKPRAG